MNDEKIDLILEIINEQKLIILRKSDVLQKKKEKLEKKAKTLRDLHEKIKYQKGTKYVYNPR